MDIFIKFMSCVIHHIMCFNDDIEKLSENIETADGIIIGSPTYASNIFGGKWKLRIIYLLAFHEVLRYGELKRLLAPITHKMLKVRTFQKVLYTTIIKIERGKRT